METIVSIARHAGQILAGYLMTKGYIDDSMKEIVIGLLVSAATLGWFFYDKKKKES